MFRGARRKPFDMPVRTLTASVAAARTKSGGFVVCDETGVEWCRHRTIHAATKCAGTACSQRFAREYRAHVRSEGGSP